MWPIVGSEFDELTHGDGTREIAFAEEGAPAGGLWITIASAAGVMTLPLPSRGRVLLGRAEDCEVRVDDGGVSRRHAALHIGDTVELEDLGSRNGTRVRGATVPSGARVVVSAGDIVSLGSTVVVFQAAPTERPRRILAHGYFELYLEGECARAAAGGSSFAVARIRVGERAVEAAEHLLAISLSPIDQFALYAPGEYEILMLQLDEVAAQARLEELTAQLAPLGIEVHTGLAAYPTHGRTPEEIVAAAAPREPGRERNAAGTIAPPSTLERLQPLVRRVAAGQINILILGETGSGKEVMAQTIHRLSPRAQHPMVSLNCAALSETLLESELFGHEKGSFTGATATKPGLLESASGGSVFLDEIGEMPMPMQAKLLRVIEQKQVMRVGAVKTRPIDVRFIAATHRDLEEEVARGRFRQDLYFRLNGMSLVVPPLRERLDELPSLAAAFVANTSQQLQLKVVPKITQGTFELLRSYSWPGNIRELRNVMERAVLLSSNGVITPNEIPSEKMGRTLAPRAAATSSTALPRIDAGPAPGAVPQPRASHPTAAIPIVPLGPREQWPAHEDPTGVIALEVPEAERRRIIDALEQCAGNQTQAARMLGISRRTLVYRLTEYNLPRPRRRP